VIATDKESRIVRMNPAAEQLAGWTLLEAEGKPLDTVFRIVDSVTRQAAGSLVARVLDKEQTIDIADTLLLVARDGKETPIAQSGAPIRDHNGVVKGVVLVFRDISERLRLEEQLLQARKLEVIGRLAGGIAHDFNNFLSPVLAYAEIILKDYEESGRNSDDVQQIIRAADRARDLVGQLLAFSRKQMLRTRIIDLNHSIVSAEKLVRRLIGEDIMISMRLSPSLGFIKADPSQIEQIILNLALNARDAMPQGGTLTIETANAFLDTSFASLHGNLPEGQYVQLTVKDTGTGMDSDVLSRIFEPFYTTKEQGKGTGLGLATVYGIIRQHGGAITVESRPGLGSHFTMYLPRTDETPVNVEPRRVELPQPTGANHVVLLVEDEELVRKPACRILTRYGYTVLEAPNGEQAIELVKGHAGPLHLLITDVIMPGYNGKELYTILSKMISNLKVLYMSGYSRDILSPHGVLEPGIHFLQKPFSINDLISEVAALLKT
jgi:two-component system, cell cycle sensor histidine kinase and response regulator CckA